MGLLTLVATAGITSHIHGEFFVFCPRYKRGKDESLNFF
jgi:hypothetical protein